MSLYAVIVLKIVYRHMELEYAGYLLRFYVGFIVSMFDKWLKKCGFEFGKIIYCSETNTGKEKYEVCIKNKVDVMIDDRPEVALYLAEHHIKVLLFDAPYNQNLEHENVRRVKS